MSHECLLDVPIRSLKPELESWNNTNTSITKTPKASKDRRPSHTSQVAQKLGSRRLRSAYVWVAPIPGLVHPISSFPGGA